MTIISMPHIFEGNSKTLTLEMGYAIFFQILIFPVRKHLQMFPEYKDIKIPILFGVML
jgi:hypothetical protein